MNRDDEDCLKSLETRVLTLEIKVEDLRTSVKRFWIPLIITMCAAILAALL